MTLKVGTHFSKHVDPAEAGAEAVERALAKADISASEASLAIVYSSVSLDQELLLSGITKILGSVPVIGCTTAGEITDQGVHEHSVVVMVLHSDSIRFSPAMGENIKGNAYAAGKQFAETVKQQDKNVSALMMMPDVLAGSGSAIVDGVLDVVGKNFVIVGGAPGDDYLFKQTYQYLNGQVHTGAVVGTGFSGAFSMGVGVRHGWIPVGDTMEVTRAEGAVLHELDGEPALEIYQAYLGKKAEELKSEPLAKLAIVYPLGIVDDTDGAHEYLIRDPLTVNDDGSITLAAEIEVGAKVRLMVGSADESIKAAREAAKSLMEDMDGVQPQAVFMFNCIARKKLYGIKEKHEQEIAQVQSIIGHDTPLIGFYTYGEQAPLGGEVKNIKQCHPRFHNETMVLFGIAEKL